MTFGHKRAVLRGDWIGRGPSSGNCNVEYPKAYSEMAPTVAPKICPAAGDAWRAAAPRPRRSTADFRDLLNCWRPSPNKKNGAQKRTSYAASVGLK